MALFDIRPFKGSKMQISAQNGWFMYCPASFLPVYGCLRSRARFWLRQDRPSVWVW